jgi:hypothetical protein
MKASLGSTSFTYYLNKLSPSFNFIFSFPIRYASMKVAALLFPYTLWISIFPSLLPSSMNLLVILKCFFASSLWASYIYMSRYLKYFLLFIYSLHVTFRIWVTPMSTKRMKKERRLTQLFSFETWLVWSHQNSRVHFKQIDFSQSYGTLDVTCTYVHMGESSAYDVFFLAPILALFILRLMSTRSYRFLRWMSWSLQVVSLTLVAYWLSWNSSGNCVLSKDCSTSLLILSHVLITLKLS